MTADRGRVLVTGANGFLGANAARELQGRGYTVRLMVRRSADMRALSDLSAEIFYGDIANEEEVIAAVEGCDFVVHTASVTQQWGVSYAVYEQANIQGTVNVVEACLRHRVQKLIHISTANTIGPGTRNKPANELYSFRLTHIRSGYVSTKYISQQYVLEQVERRQLPAVVINPTFMIGEYDTKPSSGQLLLHGINKRIVMHPPGGKNFVYIQDVARGIANAIETGKVGECYLMAGHNLTYREFFRLLNATSGQRPVLIAIPKFILMSLGVAGSLIGKLTGRRLKLDYSAAYMLCLYNYYSGKKSERVLNLSYTPVEDAVKRALDWFRANKYC
ncbi:NAD-dependent epimerase/dehydratase family protein [Pedobacter deserti]|uniref:NAD-dependent epimerase/dehydratase family protein n=1 Tax=Pedobacter deserti TaxID=2817382 RepID=UPI00210C4AC0|nr:NAD-dependent epimerase/dehydratase family protein [Pedobacter sp. SYSU D00382]